MTFISVSTNQISPAPQLIKKREPFRIQVDNDPKEPYVIALKSDAPFEYCTIGGVSFQKRVLPSEASLVVNAGKTYDSGVLAMPFSKKQAQSILERAKEIEMTIPSRANPTWKPNSDESEYFQAYQVLLADWVVLCPTKDYNPMAKQYQKPGLTGFAGLEDYHGAMIDEQIERGKKKKK